MGKSKFHVFAENLIINPSLKTTSSDTFNFPTELIHSTFQLDYKIVHIFWVGKFDIEFEDDTICFV